MTVTNRLFLLTLFFSVLGWNLPSYAAGKRPPCYIMYDAGSSGTRMYVYEKRDRNWIEHQGPKVSALADPVRGIRGKTAKDTGAVVDEIVSTLEAIKKDGPDKKGKPAWKAFDWENDCHVVAVSVYATAGMRIAEQENRAASAKLWSKLKFQLTEKVGHSVKVDTRTITGYEEGLYAWLAVRDETKRDNFGMLEMGGASSQVTFPCPACDAKNSAVRTVTLAGKSFPVYSYSFLGLGQDEAPKSLGFPASCAYGAGTVDPDWQANQCADKITLKTAQGIRDPYNYQDGQRGTYNQLPLHQAQVSSWYLTGAFNYMNGCDIGTCCQTKGDCYQPDSACFRAIYLKKYLYVLHIPETSAHMDTNWTKGAVVCQSEHCLSEANPPVCRWTAQDCLR